MSPRESEESYDVVSSSGEEPIAPVPKPAKPEVQQKPVRPEKPAQEEDEDEDEDEDSDEEEGDSDWE